MKFLILIVLLTGCSGYHLDDYVKNELSMIEIAQVSSIHESQLYHRLSNILKLQGSKKYLLKFKINYHENDIGIARNSDIVRRGITQVINFKLIDKENQQVLLRDSAVLHSSYSLATNSMISHAQMDANKKFLAISGANNIGYRLIMFFNKHQPVKLIQ